MSDAKKQQKKSQREPIVIAVSGGFDPLHIGHIRLLKEAKNLGDKLVVILNNDNWLMAKKGYAFIKQGERKKILGELKCVDQVVVTSHPQNPKDMSVCRDLLKLRPHIFVNGGDRYKDNIPEVATCEAIGCKMVFNIGKGGKIQSSSWLFDKYHLTMEMNKHAREVSSKKVIMFDLDGTLTKSKANLDKEMAVLFCKLLEKKKVAIIGGGNYGQFTNQFLAYLPRGPGWLKNLLILPLSGGSLYSYQDGKWKQEYHHSFSAKEKAKIIHAFKKAFREIKYSEPSKVYGEIIEDRGSQLTFSALGQRAPLAKKKLWNEKSDIRPELKVLLGKYLPDFEVRLGGLTSVDITKKGIDKAYGIQQVTKLWPISKKETVYIGDALYKGGNDHVVKRAGVATIKVKDAEVTKILIRSVLSRLNNEQN